MLTSMPVHLEINIRSYQVFLRGSFQSSFSICHLQMSISSEIICWLQSDLDQAVCILHAFWTIIASCVLFELVKYARSRWHYQSCLSKLAVVTMTERMRNVCHFGLFLKFVFSGQSVKISHCLHFVTTVAITGLKDLLGQSWERITLLEILEYYVAFWCLLSLTGW